MLTQTASFDKDIVSKIQKQLQSGKNVVVTSGFYKAMQGKGIENIVELRVTDRKANVHEFTAGYGPAFETEKEILIPQINYLTNDSWEVISALDDTNGWPILHRADYSTGQFFVLTIPDNFIDLYQLPAPVLNRIRSTIAGSLNVQMEAPGEVSLFVYDNNTCVVESFLDEEVTFNLIFDGNVKQVTDIDLEEIIQVKQRIAPSFGGRKLGKDVAVLEITLKPHSFKGFKF